MTTVPGLLVALLSAASPSPRGEVLDFSAKWCGPCQQVAPLVARLERDGLPIRSIDVDQHRDLAQRFKVTNLPTFLLVVDGKEVDRHVGALGESELRAWLQRIPTTATTPLLADARTIPTGFVADSNVRLGAPQALPAGAAPPAAERAFPESSPAAAPIAAAAAPQRAPEIEFRGSDSPLVETPAAAAPSPMASSVRLRVTIDGKINLGSGTIVACHGEEALIVTCGHIFRGFSDGGQIEVNLFQNGSEPSYSGRLIKFDLESDVGLVSIQTPQALPSVRVARDIQKAREQQQVLGIGCSGGQPPTAEELVVTAVNPYLGPDNLECTGVPVQGRSGGGLFRDSGELLGVCIAADPQRKRGVYAGLLAVHELLESAGYATLFKTVEPAVAATPAPMNPDAAALAAAPAPQGSSLLDSLTPTGDWPATSPVRSGDLRELHASPGATTSPAPAVGTPVAIGSDAADAEIVCIIRPRNQPESASQVVIIHQASPKLLSYLRGELGTSTGGGALAAEALSRRSRTASVPTMGTAPSAAPPDAAVELRPGLVDVTQKPGLQPTVLTATSFPRRYVRSR